MTTQRHRIQSGSISLQAYTWGDPTATPLVLVHGYPDNHLAWVPVAERLSDSFYVIAYDVRGAGESDRPKGRKAYQISVLVEDLEAVVDTLIPGQQFHLAGHDWGSIQSWESVTTAPMKDRILSYTTVSGPSLDHMGYWVRSHLSDSASRVSALKQLMSSWYITAFQLPLIPELMWKAVVGRNWKHFLSKVEGVKEPHANPYQTVDGRDGVWLYRSNFAPRLLRPAPRYADCPVQLIVPLKDAYAGVYLFDELHEWVPELYRRDVDAGHWLMLSDPDWLAAAIRDFIDAVERGDQQESLRSLRVA
ncbi:alpha/beta fold hydrolase [Isoalcanivorax beigongshangi]|uniref:Alpha/beta fold hydrolase n=1 Tax=Isoalcanivorax beigongshangi TaxID=3238810 RepID=A0ABV4AGM8_9GAMM